VDINAFVILNEATLHSQSLSYAALSPFRDLGARTIDI
jgi:hypothetical protein